MNGTFLTLHFSRLHVNIRCSLEHFLWAHENGSSCNVKPLCLKFQSRHFLRGSVVRASSCFRHKNASIRHDAPQDTTIISSMLVQPTLCQRNVFVGEMDATTEQRFSVKCVAPLLKVNPTFGCAFSSKRYKLFLGSVCWKPQVVVRARQCWVFPVVLGTTCLPEVQVRSPVRFFGCLSTLSLLIVAIRPLSVVVFGLLHKGSGLCSIRLRADRTEMRAMPLR